MSLLTLFIIFVVSAVISILLRPKIEDTQGPGDFRPPEPREGEPIPVICGTVKVSPSVTWFGDVSAQRVFKKEKSLFGLITTDIPLGFEYLAGMQLVLCHGPIDEILDIHIGEYEVVRTARRRSSGTATSTAPAGGWPAPTEPTLPESFMATPTRLNLNLPNLFGGPEEGGGIQGQIDLHWGSNTQGPNDYLAVWWGADIVPNYRGVAYVVLRRVNMGKSNRPEPWQFVCRRIPDVLGQTSKAEIIDADGNGTGNAAEFIYEILTNDVWGLGKPTTVIDLATFQAAGSTLFDEDLGYCGQLTSRGEAWKTINHILNHINAVIYQDPLTGLIGMKLIREDYSIPALIELTEKNSTLDEFTKGSWAEVVNETAVNYTDIRRRFGDGTAQAQNLASIQALGEVVSTSISLPGLSTHELGQDAASRTNRATSIPLTRGRIRANRIAHPFHQGFPFKITFTDYGISELVCRVVSIDYGSLLEGEIEIEFIQDPFAFVNPYGNPEALEDLDPCGPLSLLLGGYDPGTDPAAVFGLGEQILFEAPYWHVGASRRAWAAVARATNYELYWTAFRSEQGLAYQELVGVVNDFVPTGFLDANLSQETAATGVTLDVRTGGDMTFLTSTDAAGRIAGERLAMIDNGQDFPEIIAWETITDLGGGIYRLTNVMRGVLDTVPEFHPEGSRVHFYHSLTGGNNAKDVSRIDYLEDTNIAIRAVRVDGNGAAPEFETVSPITVLLQNRSTAPTPPGKVDLNGLEYPAWPSSVVGDAVLTWAHRNRTVPTTIIAQDDATIFSIEGDLLIECLIEGLPVRQFAAVTGLTVTYDIDDREADDPDLTKDVQFRITPTGAGGEVGIVRVTPRFTMSQP